MRYRCRRPLGAEPGCLVLFSGKSSRRFHQLVKSRSANEHKIQHQHGPGLPLGASTAGWMPEVVDSVGSRKANAGPVLMDRLLSRGS